MDRKKRKSGLLTKELKRRLPKLYKTEGIPFAEKMVVARFVDSGGFWRWFVIEGEEIEGEREASGGLKDDGLKEDWEFYGVIVGTGVEFGFFKLSELERTGTVSRDTEWRPKRLKEVVLL